MQISYVYQTQTKISNNDYTEDEPIPKSNLSQKRSVVEDGYFLIATIYLGLRLHNQNQNVKPFILESTPPPWIPESMDMTRHLSPFQRLQIASDKALEVKKHFWIFSIKLGCHPNPFRQA